VKVFAGDEKLTTALLDRLAHHATVIATKGRSYRMRKRLDDEVSPPTVPSPCPSRPAKRKLASNHIAAGWISFGAAKWISLERR
jgi:hypothetical protein